MAISNGFGLLSKDPGRPLHYRFLKRQRHRVNDVIFESSMISNDPVLDPDTFDWTTRLAANWEAGKWLMFDDTNEHEVQNDTGATRIVLLCQVERPLRQPGKALAAGLMAYVRRSHFVQEAKDNLGDWETAFAKAERELL